MGLAPYGDPSSERKRVEGIVKVDETGAIHVDLSFFSYQFHGATRCGPRFYATFGPPRQKDEPLSPRHEDIAAAFQTVLEERALTMARMLRRRTGCRYLVVSGGVALNSVMNGRLLREA